MSGEPARARETTDFGLPADLVEDDVRQCRAGVDDHSRLHERPVERIAFVTDREVCTSMPGQVSTTSGKTSSLPSKLPVPLANPVPPSHKVSTLSVAASSQFRSLEQVIERSESPPSTGSMPSHKPVNDRRPKDDLSPSACAENANASGSRATAARSRNRLIGVSHSNKGVFVTTSNRWGLARPSSRRSLDFRGKHGTSALQTGVERGGPSTISASRADVGSRRIDRRPAAGDGGATPVMMRPSRSQGR